MQPYSDKLAGVRNREEEKQVQRFNLQDRDTVVGEVLDLDVPAGSLEVAVAPRVIVESEEVGSNLLRTAVHVVSSLHAVGGNIGSGVTDGNLAKLAGLDVVSHVTGDGLDVGS